eukprot:TRINITY_DN28971_c0_g1_i2.p1 TRINITY_DN28971_c0_g1~~TRINITY_DN28971_c0_g1_i2.p1  ORF type:complete len:467 (+),score=110.84 TRINITY_DN28971_c0_g1_i2:29-1402(+)
MALRVSTAVIGAAVGRVRTQELLCEKKAIPSKFDCDWDRRHPYDKSVACQGNTRVLLFIRHGQYESRGGPQLGLLTDVGREQAKMAGQHIVARMREDPTFKRALFKLTSSAMERAIETADIIEKEILDEVEWVDVKAKEFAPKAKLRFHGMLDNDYAEFLIDDLPESQVVEDKNNLLQPRVVIREGSRVRVPCHISQLEKLRQATSLKDLTLRVPYQQESCVSVYQKLTETQRLPSRCDWECSGCEAAIEEGCIHWSDDAESNGLGFCSACFKAGPVHKKLKVEDTFSRVTWGEAASRFRMPNDKNLNEACPEPLSGIEPSDPLFDDFAELASLVQKEQAQANAGFCTHMHRATDHKRLKRKDRKDAVRLTFAPLPGAAASQEQVRYWTSEEFERLTFDSDGLLPCIFDEEAKLSAVQGPFRLKAIGDEDAPASISEMKSMLVKQKQKQMSRGKQVD